MLICISFFSGTWIWERWRNRRRIWNRKNVSWK